MDSEDKKLATEFGIENFDETVQMDLLGQYYEMLNLRLAMKFEDELSDAQMHEFEQIHDLGDDDLTENWLKTTVKQYDSIVDHETAAVKADLKTTIVALGLPAADAEEE
ncbi:hypothetical protein H7097_01525 [Aeromicrobium sp.]|nr:hypothetical protein [Candidatus Saccharibacteria bacterium]